jgi:O-antigen ligase
MEVSARCVAEPLSEVAYSALALLARLLQMLIAARPFLFLAMLGFMLFRPPGSGFFPFDRVAFAAVCLAVALQVVISRQQVHLLRPVTWPLLGLIALSSCNVLCGGYNAEAWSMFAAKWLLPLTAFQVASVVFDTPRSRRALELFTLVVLAYLCFIAVAFLLNANWAVLPSYILDASQGIHADRARGPFLQAVANGLTLNLLGLLAIDSFRRNRLRGWAAAFLLGALPIAVLATKTRAVWLAFGVSVSLLLFSDFLHLQRSRKFVLVFVLVCVAVFGCVFQSSFSERLADRSPVEFRLAMYEAGWQMFQEKPVAGWGFNAMREELGRRISDFHQDSFYLHNSYLEVLVEHGLIGLFLYVWMALDLFWLGRRRLTHAWTDFPDRAFRTIWPVMLLVYFLNACFVGMNYQFVNVFLFTIAGLLAAQNHAEERMARVS